VAYPEFFFVGLGYLESNMGPLGAVLVDH